MSTLSLKKDVPPLDCYNFEKREWIMIFFGRNVTDRVSSLMLYDSLSHNQCIQPTGLLGHGSGERKLRALQELDCVARTGFPILQGNAEALER